MVYDMLYGSYKVYDTGKNSGLFDLYLDLTAGTIVDLIVLWLKRDDMSYDEFLSLYVKIYHTDMDLLRSIQTD